MVWNFYVLLLCSNFLVMKHLTFKRIQIGFLFRAIRTKKNNDLKKRQQEGKIFIRIGDGLTTPIELYTGVKCLRNNWRADCARVIGRSELVKSQNNSIQTLEVAVRNIHIDLVAKNEKVNPKIIKDILTGESEKNNDLLECFSKMIERDSSEHAITTQKHYRTTQKYLKSFIQNIYKKDTLPLAHIDIEFIESFNSWLFANTSCHKNGASKHHFRLQRFLDLELRRKNIHHNPYSEYKISKQKSNVTFLETEELDKLINAELDSTNNHELVRDGFLFCVYTGLSYSDFERITRDKIFKDIDGKPILRESRLKIFI